MSIFIPKARRPTFELHLRIHDVVNIPLITGVIFVKWNIEGIHSRHANDQTEAEPVLEHRVTWEYETCVSVRMIIDNDNLLKDKFLILQVLCDSHTDSGVIRLGILKINLTEYVYVGQDTRKYLLADSKINATIRIGISLKQTSGNKDFRVSKTLGKPQVFSGLTGLLTDGKELKRRDDEVYTSTGLASAWAEKMLHSIKDFNQKTTVFHMHTRNNKYDTREIVDDIFFGGTGWAEPPKIADIVDAAGDTDLISLEIRQKSWVLPSEKVLNKRLP
ncbi:cortical variant C2 domain protein, human FAM102A and FAM102B ortholog, implicated in signalling or endocytosis [Schizosaccharomyces pombe]|uniref:Uncharacterized protein C1494.08c n=1 Tax=Schizosaccharomyces pombe (strain 972 / ATCC 24843) TaxID=284812 RepID=YQK8_SCHPO|nr:uncharacterized protein SPCC1494.08c [Schizosaccharomyces pombe]O60082.1 RecName: Full=Uncharacterized protein C1494.08c [Schizosaccharomyces pombe 972h-]CAA19306.1 conserved fungal protein [Schizosaccharomyces pombe]|eukprot:NP_588533.1 uncharacterized protein SPCC1494.08c [Schizosaccharomyces pombe]